MARYIPGPLVSEISGRVGQSIFTSWKGVGVIRQMPVSIYNPNSPAQAAARAAASYISQAWNNVSLNDRSAWEELASEINKDTNKQDLKCTGSIFKGYRGPFSGYNAFLMINMMRYSAGLVTLDQILYTAPINLPRAEALKTVSAVAANGQITFSWTLITNAAKNERLKLWLRSTDAKIHPQLVTTQPVFPESSYVISTVRSISGLEITIPPGKYDLQAQTANINGLVGVDSEIVSARLEENDMITWFTNRQAILSLVGVVASVPETSIDLSAFIPSGANGIIGIVEITEAAPTINPWIFELRQDTAKGNAVTEEYPTPGLPIDRIGQNFTMPVKSDRTIKYQFTIGAGDSFDVNVYLLGYFS